MNTRRSAAKVNDQLYLLGLAYHDFIPVYQIDEILTSNGFDATEPGMYCGRIGRVHEPVGQNRYLTINWHKMPSGKYEIVAYLN